MHIDFFCKLTRCDAAAAAAASVKYKKQPAHIASYAIFVRQPEDNNKNRHMD